MASIHPHYANVRSPSVHPLWISALFICLSGFTSSLEVLAAQEELPSGPEIIERYIEATGGRTAYDRIFNRVVQGEVEVLGKYFLGTPKDVTVFDVLDRTAAAKLTGAWGIDYLHLAKYDGKWKIVQVLWQSPPR